MITREQDWPQVAVEFLKRFPEGAGIGLKGELGMGKTTFVRALVQKLLPPGTPSPRVVSPTFTLQQSYSLLRPVEHFDLYRLEHVDGAQLESMGYWEAWQRVKKGRGYLVVEWPERAAPITALELDEIWHIKMVDLHSRELTILK